MYTSFILYIDMAQPIQSLRDAEAGRLLKAIYRYVETGEAPDNLKGSTAMCFSLIRRSLDRDREKYEAVRKRRAEAGRCGGLRTQELYRQREAIAAFAPANAADNENGNENGNDNKNENGNGNDNVPVPPCPGAGDTPSQRFYGKYRNLAFTKEEYAALQAEFPEDFEARLERLSEYAASSGKKYASALATIRAWARKEEQDGNDQEHSEQWSLGNVL